MKLIKDQGVSFILNACLAVLTLVSIIIYAVNKSLPYFTEANVSTQIIWFLVLALLIVLANIAVRFTPLKDNKIVKMIFDLLSIVTTFFLVGAAVYFLSDRVYYMVLLYSLILKAVILLLDHHVLALLWAQYSCWYLV